MLQNPVFALQAHHQRPWTITEREFANNVHKVFKPALTFAGACGMAMVVAVARAQQPLPSGLAVANGQATAVVRGNQMTVTNRANAILNWQSFSVGNGNSVRFDQPGASSQVLNRVVGNAPSSVLGSPRLTFTCPTCRPGVSILTERPPISDR